MAFRVISRDEEFAEIEQGGQRFRVPASVVPQNVQQGQEFGAGAQTEAQTQQAQQAGADLSGVPERQRIAVEFFTEKGLTQPQAIGFVGNLIGESGSTLDPSALNAPEGSIGIAQWRGARRRRLQQFAEQRGTSETDFRTQLEFAWEEMNTTEKAAGDAIRAASTVEEAVDASVRLFERPANPDRDVRRRTGFARAIAKGQGVGASVPSEQGMPTAPDRSGGGPTSGALGTPPLPEPPEPPEPTVSEPQTLSDLFGGGAAGGGEGPLPPSGEAPGLANIGQLQEMAATGPLPGLPQLPPPIPTLRDFRQRRQS